MGADSGLPPHKQFNRINSFTLTGNSSLHFELSRDPTELIGAIFWQLKRIKIEKYDPIVIHTTHQNQYQQPTMHSMFGGNS